MGSHEAGSHRLEYERVREMRFIASALRFAALCMVFFLSVIPAVCQNGIPAAPAPPGVQRIQNGVQLAAGDLNVKVQFYAEGTVRVMKWPVGGASEKLSLSVLQKEAPSLDVHVEENAAGVTLSYGHVKLQISKSDGSIQYLDSGNRTIFKEQGQPIFTPSRIARETSAFSVQQNFTLSADEGVYGLGQQQLGVMNYRGHTVKLVQASTGTDVPGGWVTIALPSGAAAL